MSLPFLFSVFLLQIGLSECQVCNGFRTAVIRSKSSDENRPHFAYTEFSVGSLSDCIYRCRNDAQLCQAVKLFAIKNDVFPTCQLFTYSGQSLQEVSGEEISHNLVYSAENICLNSGAGVCRDRSWSFEIFPSKNVQNNSFAFRTLPANNLESCLSTCLDFPECKSALFNQNSLKCKLLNIGPNTVRLFEDFFAPDSQWNLYENNCRGDEMLAARQCNFFRLINTGVTDLFDVRKVGISNVERCKDLCLTWREGYCRSYTFDRKLQVCYLSHTSGRLQATQPKLLNDKNLEMADLDDCIDFELKCQQEAMLVMGQSLKLISGVLQPKNSKECARSVETSYKFQTHVPYNGCGTKNSQSGADTYSNLLFLKDSSTQLITVRDKLLEIECKIHKTKDIDVAYKINIEPSNGTKQIVVQPDGPTVLKPKFKLTVLNDDLFETREVGVGETGFVQIDLDQDSDFSNLDFQVSDLVAQAVDSGQKLELYDHNGCPVNPSFAAKLEQISGHKVRGKIQFFGFANTTKIVFKGLVKPCIGKCQNLCDTGATRTRRSTNLHGGPRSYLLSEEIYEVSTGETIRLHQISSTIRPATSSDHRFVRLPQLLNLLDPKTRELAEKLDSDLAGGSFSKKRVPGPIEACLTQQISCLIALVFTLLQALLICLCVCMICLIVQQVRRRQRIRREIEERRQAAVEYVCSGPPNEFPTVKSSKDLLKESK